MPTDQAKLTYQLILLTIAILWPINKRKEKSYACHSINEAMSKAVKEWLTRRNWTYF